MEMFQNMEETHPLGSKVRTRATATTQPSPVLTGTARQIPVASILGEEREAILVHNGEAYRLRITANNKLILTK